MGFEEEKKTDSPPPADTTSPTLPQSELARTAMRISFAAWLQLAAKSKTMSETEIMKEYIRLCPYVSKDSPVIEAAVRGVNRSFPPVDRVRSFSSSSTVEDTSYRTETRGSQHTAPRRFLRFLGHALRTLALDLPLVLILLTYAATMWVDHVHVNYLTPQLEDMQFNEERFATEITYYRRPCDVSDLTTTTPSDLFLSPEATTEDAYQHQLLHGFTVFKQVLSHDTSHNLREYVNSKNRNMTEAESIFVIEGDNRFSFGLGTEHPAVAEAVMELSSHPQLRPALEKVLGDNPALIEMTAITSSYGAVPQYWHDDVIPTASAINFGRSFGPSYSVFIMLQNTTKEMGATSACPGSHYCSAGDITAYCESDGFQVVGEDGFWGEGDALLMNMNSYHRGAAHIDPNGPDRVMMIMTFVPRPTTRAETRLLSQGITFSLRWDMWGHTLDDLAHADTVMVQPWATLRALGLYKPANADWGVDFVNSASQRFANDDNGFRTDDLENFLEWGGYWWLPQFLHGPVEPGDTWHQFLVGTIALCKEFMEEMSMYALLGYAALFFLAALWPRRKGRFVYFGRSLGRMFLLCGFAYLSWRVSVRYVDSTGWAKDIKGNRLYAATTANEVVAADRILGPTTFPTKYDVLIETRYGSEELAMYNDFINGHPGNRLFTATVQAVAPTYVGYPELFQDASARYIVNTIAAGQGRFLHQGPSGYWIRLTTDEAIAHTRLVLSIRARTVLSRLAQAVRFQISEFKYGVLRNTALAKHHIIPLLKSLDKAIIGKRESTKTKALVVNSLKALVSPKVRTNLFQLPPVRSSARRGGRPSPLPPFDFETAEPTEGAWLETGDEVDAYTDGHWYPGFIQFVDAHGTYSVSFADGDFQGVDQYSIRPFTGYEPGERVECVTPEGQFAQCEIVDQNLDGSYSAFDIHNGFQLDGLELHQLRRFEGVRRSGYEYQAAY